MLIRHHLSPEALDRDRQRLEAMQSLGFDADQSRMKLFPTNPSTQKGNLAEVVLAEYIAAANEVSLPVYRLRYNPNVEQAMKGDDVLAFDLDSDPVRVIVGESKFRTISSRAAVTDIIEGLVRSYKGGIPASLQFVANRLFETGKAELGERILECTTLFALEKLRLEYVGLLMGDTRSANRMNQHTDSLIFFRSQVSKSDDCFPPKYLFWPNLAKTKGFQFAEYNQPTYLQEMESLFQIGFFLCPLNQCR